eukprot:118463-Rhodomonas_salina.1
MQMLGWAGDLEEERGIAGAVQARAVQARDFNTAFQNMQTMLRKQTYQLVRGEEFYHKQISLFANAALRLTI